MNGTFSSINDLIALLNNSGGNSAVDIVVAPPGNVSTYLPKA
jgi:hypothetical protein